MAVLAQHIVGRELGPIVYYPPQELNRYMRSPRKHSPAQEAKLRSSLAQFGVVVPVPIDRDKRIIDGHALVDAAVAIKLPTVPTIMVDHLSDDQVRVLRLTLNRLGEQGEWDTEMLRAELLELDDLDFGFSLEITGWDAPELDVLMFPKTREEGESEEIPEVERVAISRLGDIWELGDHRLVCGSSLEVAIWSMLMQGEVARMGFTDPPYNTAIFGQVSGLGRVKHREFAMASGEMTDEEFAAFLQRSLELIANHVVDGGIIEMCMDWRGQLQLLLAAKAAKLQQINLCVWAKTNGSMGSLFRSQHELIAVLKKGQKPHINNVQLGKFGRNRTNLWTFAGANAFGATRQSDLADHPTVKPTALVAEAIRDVTKIGDIVVDPFIGSGSTILAAERTRRKCRGIELDPLYVDVAVRRWQEATGREARLAGSERSFAEVASERLDDAQEDEGASVPPVIRRRSRPGEPS